MMYDYGDAIVDFWDDCNIGGGLKRKLAQFKAKASEVARNFLPAPTPQPIPIPVTTHFEALDLSIESGYPSTMAPGS